MTEIAAFQSSIDVAPMRLPPAPIPALLITRLAALPNRSSLASARLRTCSRSVTSHTTSKPSPPACLTNSADSFAVMGSLSAHTTRPPRRASSTANARPIPLPAPVTTAWARWVLPGELPNGKNLICLPFGSRH
ncbi:Uncharacterised protein [Mycobacteroides abscessus subsp. abscessus]|nr:Uncharacterised protein [Mycobacteroides abscessus subsp. abscessus]